MSLLSSWAASKNTDDEIRDGVWSDSEKVTGGRLTQLGGSGKDGAKTVASSENLTPDTWYEYTTLTVNSGQTLGLSGAGRMLLRCSGKVTVNGTISAVGKGTAGGAGGDYSGADNGKPGSTGAAGETNGGLISAGGSGGGGGGGDVYIGGNGGVGGTSADTGCGTGGIAGAGGAIASIGGAGGIGGTFEILTDIEYLLDSKSHLILNIAAGGGGGGSGSGAAGRSGGLGGHGGAGGGCILIVAPEVEIVSGGTISAGGTNGAASPECSCYSNVGDGGGGGGGAGGNIIIITKKYTNDGSVTIAGGTGGAGITHCVGHNSGAGGAGGAGNLKVVLV